MKTIELFLNCVTNKIKKYFFKEAETDISHECEKLFDFEEKTSSPEEMKYAEEYLDNYKVTTRWQTL